jgi:hypothetical protein
MVDFLASQLRWYTIIRDVNWVPARSLPVISVEGSEETATVRAKVHMWLAAEEGRDRCAFRLRQCLTLQRLPRAARLAGR